MARTQQARAARRLSAPGRRSQARSSQRAALQGCAVRAGRRLRTCPEARSAQGSPASAACRRIAAAAAAAALAALLGLAGCASTPPAGSGATPGAATGTAPRPATDGPPAAPPADLAALPDPQPRVEPLRRGGPNKPYEVFGQRYVPLQGDVAFEEDGLASWYGRKFHGLPTASGEIFDMYALSAAHPTMPLPSYALVRNPANGRQIVVRVNDRGPFKAGRVIDLSYAAAVKLGVERGVAPVQLRRLTHDEIRSGSWREGSPAFAAAPAAAAAAGAGVTVDAAAGAVTAATAPAAATGTTGTASPAPAAAGVSATGATDPAAAVTAAAARDPTAAAVDGAGAVPIAAPTATPAAATAGVAAADAGQPASATAAAATAGTARRSAAVTPLSPRAAAPSAPRGAAPPMATARAEAASGGNGAAVEAAAAAAAAPAAAFVAARRSGFWVQFGAFAKHPGALELRRLLAAEFGWLEPWLHVVGDGRLYRVQAGPFGSRAESEDIVRRLRAAPAPLR